MNKYMPLHWDIKQLGELADIKTGDKNNQDKVANGKYPFFVRSDKVHQINSYSYDGEAILVPGEGRIGEIFHYINGKFDWHQRVYKISNFKEQLDGKFLYYYLQKNFARQAYENSVKATVDSLRLPVFQQFKILLPPINTQKKIVSIFESVDQMLINTKKEIAQIEKLKKALTQQFFTKGIGHTKFKKTEAGKIPENWEAATLVESGINIIDGDRGSNYPKQNEFSGAGFCLFLNTPNVNNGKFDFDSAQFISEEKDKKLRKGKLQRNDIVLTTRGTVGRIAHYDQKVPFDHIRINSGMVILRVSSEFFAPFVFQQFLSEKIQNAMKAIGSGSAQPQLPIGSLNHLVIVKPPLKEQKEIVEILQSIDKQIEINKKLKSKQEQLKRGLMQDLLTGKVAL